MALTDVSSRTRCEALYRRHSVRARNASPARFGAGRARQVLGWADILRDVSISRRTRGIVWIAGAWLALAPRMAAAEPVGVVVTGDLEPELLAGARRAAMERLRAAGNEPEEVPVQAQSIPLLRECVRGGPGDSCRQVLQSPGAPRNWLFLDAQVERGDGTLQHAVTGWWLAPDGRVLSGDRRYCPACTPRKMAASITDLVAALLQPRAGGPRTVLVVHATPPGALIEVDGRTIGATSVQYVVRPGAHRLRVDRDGYRAEERQVSVAPGATATVDIALSPEVSTVPREPHPGRGRRIAGWALIGGGAAAVASGVVLVAVDRPELEESERRLEHRSSVGPGLAVGAAGLVAAGVGTWLILTSNDSPRPLVSIAPMQEGGLWVQGSVRF